MIHEVKHANGITDVEQEDPWHMRRPYKITNDIFQEHLLGGVPPEVPEIPNGLGPYEYDGGGNITEVGCKNNFYCRRYHYDGVSRLLEDSNGTTSEYQRYGYDRWGNLTQITTDRGQGAQTQTLSPSATSNHLGATAYDASGNQLHWGTLQYEWDPFNNLKTLQGQGNYRTYLYTADDERIWTSNYTGPEAPDTWSFTLRSLDNKVLTVYEAEGNGPGSWRWIKDYIYRDGLQLAAEYADGSQRHFTLDHLGTPRMLSDKAGFYKADYHYFGFGEQINPESLGEPSEAMKFTGHERDFNNNAGAGDDLDYMHARYCNPNLGRFLSVDPKVRREASASSQVWGRYSYAAGNPIAVTDPDGREIVLQVHKVFGNNFHSSIRIEPENQARYSRDRNFLRRRAITRRRFATIGAGPASAKPQDDILVSDVNRPTDVDLSNKVEEVTLDLGGRSEDVIIDQLFAADTNYQDSLDYDLFPAEDGDRSIFVADDGYNSNSYTAGLLLAVGIDPPDLNSNVPGFDKPVPDDEFQDPDDKGGSQP